MSTTAFVYEGRVQLQATEDVFRERQTNETEKMGEQGGHFMERSLPIGWGAWRGRPILVQSQAEDETEAWNKG